MNKIFKIIWSKTKGCYVVASEFAKSHQAGGVKRTRRLTAAIMTALVLAPQASVWATTIDVGGETWSAGSAGSGVMTITGSNGITVKPSNTSGAGISKSMTVTIGLDDSTTTAISTAVASVS
ncbi:ESPR domain-containing protein [uncultured Veillonella sp.]|uniref:ESPR domain-containing protein n=1 Tax=uncultured Veillonella sp. TaxID=159268 RepID=UPI0026379B0D|nr:ESPR domain-containing protein [uncultured Veillonella sp.]